MANRSDHHRLAASRANERADRSARDALRELQDENWHLQLKLHDSARGGFIYRGLRNVRMLALAVISSGALVTAIPYAFPPETSADKQCEIAANTVKMAADGKLDEKKYKALIDDAKRELTEDCMR